jgi:hypothetical protein
VVKADIAFFFGTSSLLPMRKEQALLYKFRLQDQHKGRLKE